MKTSTCHIIKTLKLLSCVFQFAEATGTLSKFLLKKIIDVNIKAAAGSKTEDELLTEVKDQIVALVSCIDCL